MKQQWTADELEELWTLHPDEFALLRNKTRENKLCFALILKYFQVTSYFPNDVSDIPKSITFHIAKQLGIPEKITKSIKWSQKNSNVYRRQIRDYLGFRRFGKGDIHQVKKWLIETILPEGNQSISYLQNKVYQYLNENKIEPLSSEQLERHILSALNTFESNLFRRISRQINKNNRASLLDLVETQERQSANSYYLRDLKQDAGNVSLESILDEVKKINRIRDIGLPMSLFEGISPRVLEKYKARIMSERPSEIRDHKDSIKFTTLAIFCHVRGQAIMDNLVDLLIQVVHKVGKQG